MNQNISKNGIMTGGLLEDSTVVKLDKNDINLTTGGYNITINSPIEANQFYEY